MELEKLKGSNEKNSNLMYNFFFMKLKNIPTQLLKYEMTKFRQKNMFFHLLVILTFTILWMKSIVTTAFKTKFKFMCPFLWAKKEEFWTPQSEAALHALI